MHAYIIKDEGGPFLRVEAEGMDKPTTSIEVTKDSYALMKNYFESTLKKRDYTPRQVLARAGQTAWMEREDGSTNEDSTGPDFPDWGTGEKARLLKASAEARANYSPKPRLGEAEDIEDEKDVEYEGTILKTDPAKRLVFGWAYITHDREGNLNIDKSGDFLEDPEELETSAYNYVIKSRHGDADHTNVKASDLVESIVFTPEKIAKMGLAPGTVPTGWWVGFKVHDDRTWERVEKGELRSFSIHGKGVRSKVEE